jgi:chaperonin GroEL
MKSKQRPGVVFQPGVHQALRRGIHKMVSAIRPTLGPLSRGVAIDNLNRAKSLPEFLDEGGPIARRIIELSNRDEDMGAMLARSMIVRQHENVGDGTATVAVLFEAIFSAGLRYIAAGGNAMQIRRHLERLLPSILDELDRMAFRLEGQEALTQMAHSLCHHEDMATLLGEAFDLLGEYGRLEIREDYGRVLRREYVEGTYYHSGLFSRVLFSTDSAATVTFENPAIFVCDFEVEDYHELFPVLQTANTANVNGLVIITRSMSEKAVSLLVAHNRMDKFKVMGVRLPGLNPTDRAAALDDLSKLTGATPFVKVAGDTLENVTEKHFGQSRRVWANLETFGLTGGRGNPRQLREHLQDLRTQYHNAADAEERKRAHQRVGNLLGGSVTLWVGGFTEPEINARKRLMERTALTLRAAIQEGVVPGGGIALLNCRSALEKQQAAAQESQDTDERAAYRILIDALAAPARTIFRNAGCDPGELMAQLSHECPEKGFDVVAKRIVNLRESGILDSALVLKTCVKNAISTAALALTIDSLVHLARPEITGKPR